jgi:hypothetical protein
MYSVHMFCGLRSKFVRKYDTPLRSPGLHPFQEWFVCFHFFFCLCCSFFFVFVLFFVVCAAVCKVCPTGRWQDGTSVTCNSEFFACWFVDCFVVLSESIVWFALTHFAVVCLFVYSLSGCSTSCPAGTGTNTRRGNTAHTHPHPHTTTKTNNNNKNQTQAERTEKTTKINTELNTARCV